MTTPCFRGDSLIFGNYHWKLIYEELGEDAFWRLFETWKRETLLELRAHQLHMKADFEQVQEVQMFAGDSMTIK